MSDEPRPAVDVGRNWAMLAMMAAYLRRHVWSKTKEQKIAKS